MTGTFSPSFIVSFEPSAPRSCGFAITFVRESDSRNRTIAVGTAKYKAAMLTRREIVLRLTGAGDLMPLGGVDVPVLVVVGVVPGVVGAVVVALGDVSGEKIVPRAYSDRFTP